MHDTVVFNRSNRFVMRDIHFQQEYLSLRTRHTSPKCALVGITQMIAIVDLFRTCSVSWIFCGSGGGRPAGNGGKAKEEKTRGGGREKEQGGGGGGAEEEWEGNPSQSKQLGLKFISSCHKTPHLEKGSTEPKY